MGVFVSPHSFCNSFNFLSGSRVRARIGLNSVHSVILLLIRERVVRLVAERCLCPLQLLGWKIFPKSGEGVGEGHPAGEDGRKGRAQVLQ